MYYSTHVASFYHLDSKATEAAQSAYYDPNRPQCAYVPPPEYYVSIFILRVFKIIIFFGNTFVKRKENVEILCCKPLSNMMYFKCISFSSIYINII